MPTEHSSTAPSFRACSRTLIQQVGRGTKAKGIRRVFLLERETSRVLELHTAFLDHEFGLKALNTQIAVLADLAFFYEWCIRRRKLDPSWIPPEHRAVENLIPLSAKEVKDLARWCQRAARDLMIASLMADRGVEKLPLGDVVASKTRNRRLRYIAAFLKWITISLATDENTDDESAPALREIAITKLFEKELISESKPAAIVSLTPFESAALNNVLADKDVFPDSAVGTRDRLIFELLGQGLRAGEMLKVRCTDVVGDFPIDKHKLIAVVAVQRHTNDPDDTRVIEPANKTKEGLLPIPRRIAQYIDAYIRGPRRVAIDTRRTDDETQYLLVNHEGRHVGKALSQRNLNRIVAKLKGRFDLPDDLHPHSMRHTHFTELADSLHKKGKSSADIREMLIDRGRWSPNTTMTALYTARFLMNQSADYVEERDKELSVNRTVSRV